MGKKGIWGGDEPKNNDKDITQSKGIAAAKEIKGMFFRYIPLILLYVFSLIYIFNNDTQFIIFICLLVLTIFGMIFIIHDLFAIDVFRNCFFGIKDENDREACKESGSIFLKMFMFSLIIGIFSQFISLSILIAVFDYGKKSTNSFIVKQMSNANRSLLYKYKEMLIASSAITIILAFFLGFSYGIKFFDENSAIPMKIMRNIGCIALSLALLGITSYEIYLSVEFLKIKKHKSQLYIVS